MTPRLSDALLGRHIVIAVDRRSEELTAALERHGATVTRAPALTNIPHIDDATLWERTRALIAEPPEIVVVTTGIGFRGWFEAATDAGLADQLRSALEGARLLARGPKARGAIHQAGLRTDWVADSEMSAEIAEHLCTLEVRGRRVAVQHHGAGADGLDELLEEAGADVVSLTVYRWGPPADPEAVHGSLRAAARGEVDAVVFTAAPGASRWLEYATEEGVLDAIRGQVQQGRLVIAGVGPVTAAPLESQGLTVMTPERSRLGALVRLVVRQVGQHADRAQELGASDSDAAVPGAH